MFGADLRSLAVFRIVLASIVLLDMVGRAQNLQVHYADTGVLPRHIVIEALNPWRWSLYFLNGTVQFQGLLVGLTVAAALAMLIGYRTRTMTIIVWVMMLSIHLRNPLVSSASDTLVRLLLFWSMFLPLGACWSLDRRRRPASERPSIQFLSMATVGLFAQIAFMYWFTALLKTGDTWRSDGTALYLALGAKHITRDFGDFLFQFETLLQWLTFASLGLEVIAPILLFSPIATGPVRTAAVAAIMAFQLGIYLTMDLGIFPWTSALCMVCFLPAWFWDRVLPWARTLRHRIPVPQLGHAAAAHVGFQDRLFLRVPWASAPVPEATHEPPEQRQRVDSVEVAAGPDDRPTLRSSPLLNIVAASCLFIVFGVNLATVSDYRVPEQVAPLVDGAALNQRWGMFAPAPINSTVWFVYRGTLADETEVDLLPTLIHDDPQVVRMLSWEEPDDIAGNLFGDKYWRKYVDAVAVSHRGDERLALARYICRTWNSHYDGEMALTSIDMFQLWRRTLPDYEQAPVKRAMIADYSCV
ncbi:MAG: HTTM domain-containing protein [Chloroflexota bacterium]|nr:HTTM domain-containing protein [Chloroflexota bacterium]